MKWLASPVTVAAGCGLVVATNLALLGAASWNRGGEPEAELSLTERELALPVARQPEDSGLLLSLSLTHETPAAYRAVARWRDYELPPVDYDWLDRAKLREIGFRTDIDPSDPEAADRYRRAMARRAYLVLEYDGEAWTEWLAGRERQIQEMQRQAEQGKIETSTLADAEAVLALDRTMRSRLFPVDAGTDADALRDRYPDRHRYAVVEGLFRPRVVERNGGAAILQGRVVGLVVSQVQVPRELRRDLDPLLPAETRGDYFERQMREARSGWPAPAPPRYEAALAIGRRHEPWLESVTALDGEVPARGTQGTD